jgi:cytidylate kinase
MSAPDTTPVVTIDGPVGSGKGTVSTRLAERLGWHFLDSGALYRLVAIRAIQAPVDPENEPAVAELAGTLDCDFTFDGAETRIWLGGEEVTRELRSEPVSLMASRVASLPAVRAALVDRQREFRRPPGLVADGRDMGTVIFPDATVKLFLTASTRARAERRYKQLKEKGESVNLPRLFRDLEERDRRDSSRAIAPLKPAEDAMVIDSTEMTVDEVVENAYNLVLKSLSDN